ncbi:MAG: FtsW/RodA/SpoVE family cell cycle protein, partial [Lachnospiraceae bacterium]|nr:FtsW/RodA/SpoVE family cell cycle protein [Lachnospiraceae bacterium]
MLNRIKQYDWRQYNVSLLCIVILLCLISAFSLYLAGGEDKGMAYMKSQILGMAMGLVIVVFLSLMDYHFICKFAGIYYILGIALTAATYSPLGVTNSTEAARWIRLGGITFQPSELMKIILILTLAVMFAKNQNKNRDIRYLIPMMLVTLVPVVLIVRQPDLSSGLVSVFILVCMIFIAGISYRILVPIILLGIPIGLVGFWYIQQPGNLIFRDPEDYHYKRIMAWLHPETDVDERWNYQQNRSIRAIASGKLYGKYLQDGGYAASPSDYNSVGVRESEF